MRGELSVTPDLKARERTVGPCLAVTQPHGASGSGEAQQPRTPSFYTFASWHIQTLRADQLCSHCVHLTTNRRGQNTDTSYF